jgi:hypothetical protein
MKWTTLKFQEILEENIFQYRITSGASRKKLVARVKADIKESARHSGEAVPEKLTQVHRVRFIL